jgi:hypothetical protein
LIYEMLAGSPGPSSFTASVMALPFGVTMACRTRRSVAPAWPRLSSFATCRLTVV